MKSILNMCGISICLLQGDENLALMTTTATLTVGTFSTNLSIFKCVITLIHLVHLWQTATTFLLQGPSNHSTCAELQKLVCRVQNMITLSRTRHRIHCEIRSSLILTVQHLNLVNRITLFFVCGKKTV